ncbi:MAG: thiol reductant ABC exporter subunit CydD [Moraxella sp.]|nr:MAG: thiol reductant ABC exporter subunit CydD [Moraxella sp.]
MVTWLLDMLSVMVLVGQVCVLVWIFNGWLMQFLGQPAGELTNFWQNLILLAICMLIRIVLGYVRDYLLSNIGLKIASQTRLKLLNKLTTLGLARRYFGSDGVLASKIIDEPDHLLGYARFEVQKMTSVSTPLLLAGCIAFYSKTAALILLATAPFIPILMAIIGIATARKSREQMDALAQLGGRFLDWIRGANTLTRLGATDIASTDIAKSSENYRYRTMQVLKIAFLNSTALEMISAVSIALVAVYLGFGLLGKLPWSEGVILTNYQTALFILLLVPEFYAPLRRLGAEYHVKGQAVSCAKAIAPILNFKQKKQGTKILTLKNPVGFELKNLTVFGDDGRLRLSPTNAVFQMGKRTAIIGKSGLGKSTILQVLLGFGDYEGDVILTDEKQSINYQELDLIHLRQNFGYLSQSAYLLPLTIAENLKLAKSDASDDEMITALKNVQLWQIIEKLPDGIHTKLTERGGGLSGGQGQRLAIAQLLLQDANIWFLDEPTEHLDTKTAKNIKNLLLELSQNKTVIWVTHDTDFTGFDAIYDLENNSKDKGLA